MTYNPTIADTVLFRGKKCIVLTAKGRKTRCHVLVPCHSHGLLAFKEEYVRISDLKYVEDNHKGYIEPGVVYQSTKNRFIIEQFMGDCFGRDKEHEEKGWLYSKATKAKIEHELYVRFGS